MKTTTNPIIGLVSIDIPNIGCQLICLLSAYNAESAQNKAYINIPIIQKFSINKHINYFLKIPVKKFCVYVKLRLYTDDNAFLGS